jgi:hypothetical protein
MSGMPWGLDHDGELSDHLKRHVVGLLLEHCFIAGMAGRALSRAADSLYGDPDEALRGQLFASAQQIVISAGRISNVIEPARKGAGEVRRLRQKREEFMTSLFDGEDIAILHDRAIRNRIEHYDEKVEEAIVVADPRASWVQDAIGPASMFNFTITAPIMQRRYDPETSDFVLLGEQTNIRQIVTALNVVYRVAHDWMDANPPEWQRPGRV